MAISTATRIDTAIVEATLDPYHNLPRAAVLAATSSTPVLYSGAGGYEQVPHNAADLPSAVKLTEDSSFTLWSCTKLPTAIATLQLVEQGKVGLQSNASQWVPELKVLKLFTGFGEDGEPVLMENKTVVTVEMLILHTAGFIYEYHEPFGKLTKKLGLTLPYATDSKRESITNMPFAFPPGERWHYGTSQDWLALVIEKASGLDLDTYFKKNIFEPLDIHDMTFKPDPKRISMAYEPKTPGGPYTFDQGRLFSQTQYWGGTGLSGSPRSYLKILSCILRGGQAHNNEGNEGVRLLQPETVDEMFKNHLSSEQQLEDLREFTKTGNDPWTHRGRVAAPSMGHGYGGNLSGEGLPSGRGKGALTWSGYANTYWHIDREKDLAFLIWTNIIPHSSPRLFDLWEKVEPLVYEGLAAAKLKA
ncbi:hypothetical protein JCM11641_003249 [Rhodosporidiobolus odoratus]